MNSAMFEETVIEVITSGAGYRSRPDLSKISSRVLRSRTSVACNRLSLNYPNVRRRGLMPQVYRGKRPIWKGMRDLYQGLRGARRFTGSEQRPCQHEGSGGRGGDGKDIFGKIAAGIGSRGARRGLGRQLAVRCLVELCKLAHVPEAIGQRHRLHRQTRQSARQLAARRPQPLQPQILMQAD